VGGKSSEAKGRLRAFLREGGLRVGDKLPGERELADRLGIGRMALRPLLEALENEGLVERRPQSGTFLARVPETGVSGAKVALIAPFQGTGQPEDAMNVQWLYRVVSAFERTATPAGARVLLLDQSPRLSDLCSIKALALEAAAEGVQAAVLLHPYGSRAEIAHSLALLHDRGVHPVVVSSRTYPGLASQVYFDSGWGAYLATRFLIQQGHRRIGFAGAPSGHEWVQDRLAGYRNALAAAEIVADEARIFLPEEGERLASRSDGRAAWKRWQALPPDRRPTAVAAANDAVALGVLEAARQEGFAIPGALSVIGFDNDPAALLAGLTTLERPTERLGETVARVTLEQIARGPEAATVSLRLRPVLIERGSVGPPPQEEKGKHL
jgi:GntR family transcriptional regulator of arabinose operon